MKEWKAPRGEDNSNNNNRKRSHGQQISEDWIQSRISFSFILFFPPFFPSLLKKPSGKWNQDANISLREHFVCLTRDGKWSTALIHRPTCLIYWNIKFVCVFLLCWSAPRCLFSPSNFADKPRSSSCFQTPRVSTLFFPPHPPPSPPPFLFKMSPGSSGERTLLTVV